MNVEEAVYEWLKTSEPPIVPSISSFKVGDLVVSAFYGGTVREFLLVGGGRSSVLLHSIPIVRRFSATTKTPIEWCDIPRGQLGQVARINQEIFSPTRPILVIFPDGIGWCSPQQLLILPKSIFKK